MTSELKALWDSVEQRKWRILQAVARLTPEQLQAKMPGSQWNPVELIHHLILSEEDLLRSIDLAAKRGQAPRRKLPAWMVVWALRRRIRVAVPPQMSPRDTPELETLTHQWNATRGRLGELVENGHEGSVFAHHPLCGALGTDEVLDIIDSHLHYHQRDVGA